MHWLDLGLDPEAPDPERSRPLDLLRDALAAHKTGLIAAALAAPLAVALFLVAAPPQYRAVARLAAPVAGGANAGAALAGEARLIGSRAFARRAVQELGLQGRSEFDPLAEGSGPIGAALVFLGLRPDPARFSRDERILEAFEDRLGVSASASSLDVAFRSRDRAFAAAAANRIAALYVEMRSAAPAAGAGDAPATAVISPAARPARPLLPAPRLMFTVASAAGLAALAFCALRRRSSRRRVEAEAPMEPPRALGDAPVFVRLGEPRRQSLQAGQSGAKRYADEDADPLDEIVARIRAGRGEGGALRIVGAGLTRGAAAAALMLNLARRLGNEGRSILIRLDDADGADALALSGEPGVRDLIAATASFAEAIRRDPRSRLHVIPAGPRASSDDMPREAGPIDAAKLGGVLDALARTYDFIGLLAPPLDAGDMAHSLAAQADFFALAAPPRPQAGAIARAEAELREAGAREVLVIGAPLPAPGRLGLDAA